MKRCLNCFGEYPDIYSVCPVCGNSVGCLPAEGDGLKPGTLLRERYITGRTAGTGGFGIIYRAFDTALNRTVAVKEFFPSVLSVRAADGQTAGPKDACNSGEYERRKKAFLSEARSVSDLGGCDGIPRVNDYFEENGTAYIVMEYLNGRPLSSYITNEGCGTEFAVYTAYCAACTAAFLHRNGKVHRDIAPDNIFICTDGEKTAVKLLDFGATKNTGARTGNRDIVLKPGFSPPEQYLPGKAAPSADVYSLGATLYSLLTGLLPADASSGSDAVLLTPELQHRLPRDLVKLLSRATCKKPGKRFKDAAEFAHELRRCAAKMNIKLPQAGTGKADSLKNEKEERKIPACIGDISEERGFTVATPERLLPGTVVGARYTIGLDFRRVGMCAFYTANDRLLHRRVNITEFFPSKLSARAADGVCVTGLDGGSEFSALLSVFKANAAKLTAAGRIRGCEYYEDSFSENGTCYLVSEIPQLLPLEDYVQSTGKRKLSEKDTRRLLSGAVAALDALGRQELYHGNLSPESIFTDGTESILRFPSMICYPAPPEKGGATGAKTRNWSAPELTAGSRRITAESDTYSLGAIAYRLLSGRIPEDGADRASYYLSTGFDPLPDLRRGGIRLSDGMDKALKAALNPVPGGRVALRKELSGNGT